MGMFGTLILLLIIAFSLSLFALKVIGSLSKENKYKSTEAAIQRDTDEFNKF